MKTATELAQKIADQELEACCEWVDNATAPEGCELRAARRPKPSTIKQQALDELSLSFDSGYLKKEAADTLRRALEALPD